MQQRSKEWHEFRRNHIGASDSPVIMGVSPWKDVKQLYIEKTNMPEIPDNLSAAMQRGIDLEPHCLSIFEAETGYLMSPKVLMHPTINFMAASLDGLELDNKCAVEIKCPGKKDHDVAVNNMVPEKYIPQLQHQMEVAGLNKIYYMSYLNDNDYKILEVKKDVEYTKTMLQKEADFWKCVLERTPPESTKPSVAKIESEEWKILVERYKDLLIYKTKYEKYLEETKNQLLQMANFNPSEGFGLQLTKIISKGRVEYSEIPELKGINLDNYRKSSIESWRISLDNN